MTFWQGFVRRCFVIDSISSCGPQFVVLVIPTPAPPKLLGANPGAHTNTIESNWAPTPESTPAPPKLLGATPGAKPRATDTIGRQPRRPRQHHRSCWAPPPAPTPAPPKLLGATPGAHTNTTESNWAPTPAPTPAPPKLLGATPFQGPRAKALAKVRNGGRSLVSLNGGRGAELSGQGQVVKCLYILSNPKCA